MSKVIKLHSKRYLIDVMDLGMENRTGSYVLHEKKTAIIDTSASPSIPHLLKGLKSLQISPDQIDYLIVTHIHLDHAGGVGKMLEYCPNATVVVHPKGARHIIDPSRLILGAKQVYGEQFHSLFDPIIPIEENRVLIMNDGDSLTLSEKCTLTFYDTPGHANHHFSIYDSSINGVYTGDTVGVNYESVMKQPFYLPSTSPSQFDPELMLMSVQKIKNLNPAYIYFGHFGGTNHVNLVWDQLHYWIPIFIETAKQVMRNSASFDFSILVSKLSENLYEKVLNHLQITLTEEAEKLIQLDIEVCSMGLLDYLSKQK